MDIWQEETHFISQFSLRLAEQLLHTLCSQPLGWCGGRTLRRRRAMFILARASISKYSDLIGRSTNEAKGTYRFRQRLRSGAGQGKAKSLERSIAWLIELSQLK